MLEFIFYASGTIWVSIAHDCW